MERSTIRVIYALLGVGLALTFLGHGVLALKGEDTFIELLVGNYDKLLGGTMSNGAATTIVNAIGVFDVVLAAAFAGLVVAAWRGSEIAYSPLALALFGWAALWGFVTALARFTAVLDGAEVWDVVERGPNFMLPAALAYIVYKVRQERWASERHPVPTSADGGAGVPTMVQ